MFGKKYICTLLSLVFLFVPATALAENISISYPGSPGPLFKEENLQPGSSTSKEITVTNSDDVARRVAFTLDSCDGELGQVVELSVFNLKEVLYKNKTVKELCDSGEILLGVVDAGSQTKFTYNASLVATLGNEYQGKKMTFDLNLGFVSEPEPEASLTFAQTLGNRINEFAEDVLGSNQEKEEVKGASKEDESRGEENGEKFTYFYLLGGLVFSAFLFLFLKKKNRNQANYK